MNQTWKEIYQYLMHQPHIDVIKGIIAFSSNIKNDSELDELYSIYMNDDSITSIIHPEILECIEVIHNE
ncbi:hypothetical protein [Mammaliicoccus sciuri]|uniref:Uncharacterized protein n=1 Tax=Mammaliicoccus sciuri TaxID=1296 RepID=A0ABT7I0T1_MAMSC|nr:hypothetical protein [Mammaliicoccus sciuri]MDL0112774.1 hypothetical protein [Mammaliicoccus sciuri]MDL0118021.1 hypothetical protein [Mammaliicoccus sciuri]